MKASLEEKPHDPNYRLLEKAGLTTVESIPGVNKSKDKDGADLYVVPVAERQQASITKITMTGTGRAAVEYTWK